MSRHARGPAYASAFGERLRHVIRQLGVPVLQLGRELGYRDGSTLHAAMSGRCVLDVERLAQLAQWCGDQGHRVDLHWLLTGHGLDRKHRLPSEWMTSRRQAALKTLVEGLSELPEPACKRSRSAARSQAGKKTS